MFVTVKVRVVIDGTGIPIEVPGVMTPAGLLLPLLDYFLEKYDVRSSAWAKKVAFSVQLFLEYMHANPNELDTHLLFQNFAKRLLSGTVDAKTREDTTGLYWQSRTVNNRNHIISDLSLFFDWLGRYSMTAATLNPHVTPSAYDLRWIKASQHYRRQHQLLGHIWTNERNSERNARVVGRVRHVSADPIEPPAFPEDRFEELITEGFRVGDRTDYRGILITLLLHGAGFRESEPFHLFIEDVVPDPTNTSSALVRIHHPSNGHVQVRSSIGTAQINRSTFLLDRYGILPRTKLQDARHAGWKNPRLDGEFFMQAYWFRPQYGEWFLDVWFKYLGQIVGVKRPHPFAFINLAREPRGEMYKLSTYNDAHAAACRRIGLEVNKALGTTPHGHRHAYGKRLDRAGVDPEFIRLFMHHSSIESQRVYTQPNRQEISEALQQGSERLRELQKN